jgi:hypothetical protein
VTLALVYSTVCFTLQYTNNGRDDTTYKFVELVYFKDNYTKHDRQIQRVAAD